MILKTRLKVSRFFNLRTTVILTMSASFTISRIAIPTALVFHALRDAWPDALSVAVDCFRSLDLKRNSFAPLLERFRVIATKFYVVLVAISS